MELIEFLFGIGITIIGVVIVEIIANYYRVKKDNNENELQRIRQYITDNLAKWHEDEYFT